MAGDWIKMRMDLPEDPAVYRLARITGLDRLSVIGRLYAFWAWADKHAVDGRVDGASTLDVDDITRHNGFADAMAQVNWLEVGADYLAIPKHDRHNGESAKERSLKNARQAKWREGKGGAVDAPPSTQASTREEKRREEKIEIQEPTVLVGSPPVGVESAPPDRVVKLADRRIPCPADALLEAFHAECPTLPRVIKLNEKRRTHLIARWREVDADSKFSSAADGIEIFRSVFRKVNASDFLTGRAKSNGRSWAASFDWLFESSTNFLKVCEGRYDNESGRQADKFAGAI